MRNERPWARGARFFWIEMGPANEPHKALPHARIFLVRCYGRQSFTVSLNPPQIESILTSASRIHSYFQRVRNSPLSRIT